MSDRTVHARQTYRNGDKAEVVHYDKSGKWWHETTGVGDVPPSRSPISSDLAVGLAVMAHKSALGEWFPGVPGGRTLDAKVRKAIKEKQR